MHLLWNYILLTEDPEIRSKMLKRKNFKFQKKFLESEFLEKFLERLPVNLYSPNTKLKNFSAAKFSTLYQESISWKKVDREIFPRIPEITIFYQIFIYLLIFSLGYVSFLYFFYTNLFQLLFLIFFNILFNSIL